MHNHRLILLLFIVWSCKTAQPVTTSVYREDLTYLRADLTEEVEDNPPMDQTIIDTTPGVFEGNIAKELDSVNLIIANRNRSIKYADGFTIQIYTGNDREAANQASQTAKTLYPELDPQISYYQPSYRVKAGQFTNRLIAHEKYEELKKSFPKALLIPERIKVNND